VKQLNTDGKIAEIRLEPETFKIQCIKFYERKLRFKCKRCATFCCKLGGPKLSIYDVERLKQAGYDETEFLDAIHYSLKNTADGSCVFLQLNKERDVHACSVYDSRPTLCRLYPFYFQKMSPSLFVLKIMLCRGISRRIGEPVDEGFINSLFDVLHDLCLQSFINAV